MRFLAAVLLASLPSTAMAAQNPVIVPTKLSADWQAKTRALFKQVIEIPSVLKRNEVPKVAEALATPLREAGFAADDIKILPYDGLPGDKTAAMVVRWRADKPTRKPMLIIGHMDVVEAKREDWKYDPFEFREEGGYFYGRGTADMKAQVAAWVDTMVRLKEEGFKPRRSIKMALTCGEETSTAFNGAAWLASHERALIDAEFALNEGGGGRMDEKGKPLIVSVQAAEKFPQNYQLEVTNPGGHSSRPVPNNAIYHLAAGLTKISLYQFPFEASDITKAYFGKMAPQVGGEMGKAMTQFSQGDMSAAKILATDPSYNSMLHTTCIPTLLSAGHANNALPQRADANINCRIFPGTSPEAVRAKLQELVGDSEIKVTVADTRSEVPKGPQPLSPKIFKPVETVAAKMWPSLPVVPLMSAGATDGAFLSPVGIPTYGVSGMFSDPDGNGAHGLNERLRVKSVYDGRDFLYQIVKVYAQAK